MSEEEQEKLPRGWTACSIGDVVAYDGFFVDGDWVESKDQDPDGEVRLIQLADVGDGRFHDKSSRFLTKKKAEELRCTFLQKGDLLVARMPDPLGRCCVFPLDGDEKYVTVVDVCAVRLGSSPVDPKYMMYLINGPKTRGDIEARKSGSTRKRISRKNLATIRLPLAPSHEQRRIVAKIEELFSESDNGIESLTTARQQLELYRQAILNYVFEGKLTAKWREDNPDELQTPEAKDTGFEPRFPSPSLLPTSWRWLPVAGVLDLSPSNGRSVKDRTGGFPVLRLTALHENRVDLSQFKEGAWDRDDAINFLVAEDDFLLARGNGSIQLVGQGRLAPKPEREVAFPDTMIRVRIDPKIMRPKFFAALWNSRLVRRQIEASARTTAGIYKINQGHVNSFGLPLCSLAEQDEILAHLDRLLPCLDDAAQEVLRRLRDSWVLRQSILMRAFAGKLVEQDPNDELASVLLERIGAEKEAQAQKERRGSTGKKANKRKAARKAEKRKDAA